MYQKSDCLFCAIARRESPCFKIWENEEFLAFLDLFPNCKGQTLVIPKEHFDSDLFLIEDSAFYSRYLVAVRQVVLLLKEKLGLARVSMVMEGMGVNHLHCKLYPLWGVGPDWQPITLRETVFFEEYPGFLTTKMGEKASQEDLEALQKVLMS